MSDGKLHDVIAYFCANYPFPDELSKARLTKMVYLADWRMAIDSGRQITDIEWVFNHYGPYVRVIERVAVSSPDFEVESGTNVFGAPKETIRVREGVNWPSLIAEEQEALDFVIEATEQLTFADFLSLVYSTYPVKTSAKYEHLDLPSLASQYMDSLEASA